MSRHLGLIVVLVGAKRALEEGRCSLQPTPRVVLRLHVEEDDLRRSQRLGIVEAMNSMEGEKIWLCLCVKVDDLVMMWRRWLGLRNVVEWLFCGDHRDADIYIMWRR